MSLTRNSPSELEAMLDKVGVRRVEELFAAIPSHLRFRRPLDLPPPLTEMELVRHMEDLSRQNTSAEGAVCFAGGGVYDRFLPAAVRHIISRSEFFTSYTPYQSEMSQGLLTAMYEFQTMICELLAMDVANASLYDGATACAEAVFLAMDAVGRRRVVLTPGLNPAYFRTVRTMLRAVKAEVVTAPRGPGTCDLELLANLVDERTAIVLAQHPNYFGCLEDMAAIGEIAHAAGALFGACVDPVSVAVLAPPGEYRADIAVGEGQGLGCPMSLGGPALGLFAAREELVRRLPGRMIGRTVDVNGQVAYALALQTREQHIRRERATSNICTNQALCALAATVYLALMGPGGLRRAAEMSYRNAHYLAQRIDGLPGFDLPFSEPFFQEFVVRGPRPVQGLVGESLREAKVILGPDVSPFTGIENTFLISATEKRTRVEMDRLVEFLERA